MVCDPAARVLVLKVATPEAFRLTVPTLLPSMVNVAVPVGVPAAEVTVAVKVTDCPTPDGFWLDVSVVVVVAATTWVTVFDVLPAKLPLAPYTAEIACDPAASEVVLKV